MTHEEYFDPAQNRYLSNSKISDYLKCPSFFRKKHIDCKIKGKRTDPMLIGSAVDTWLTVSEQAFRDKYICVTRRDLKGQKDELNITQFNLVVALCKAVEATSAYQEIKGHTAQVILTEDNPIGEHFKGLCGIPDWFIIEDGIAYITDLKTAFNSDPNKYFYTCVEHNYFRQQAMYQRLIKSNYTNVRGFVSRHLVVEKDEDGINRVRAFILDQELIEMEKSVIQNTINRIAEDKTFNKLDADWKSARVIGQKDDTDTF